ncbi:exported hypothetical protein [Acidobacteriia bacterium SbA2]|nr:exported hypothetical protein [Acidobacteriia bacterium SbA2]
MEHFPSSFPRRSMVLLLAWLSLIIFAEAQTVSNNTDQSWTVTTVAKGPGAPLRTTEKYSKSGGRILCEKNVEVLGPDGYRPSFYVETETDQEDATTTRSIQHSYRPDGNGGKQLVQVTEEEAKDLPNGESDVVRTTSKPNPGGDLQIVERDDVETKKGGPDTQETKSTAYRTGSAGKSSDTLAPARQTDEQRKRGDNDHTETTKTTKWVDSGNGGLKLAEMSEKVVKEEGENRNSEEHVWLPDLNGNLSEVSQTVVKDKQGHGQNVETAETYSIDVPGKGRDGQFHLIQRVTTVRSGDAGRTTTEQQMEQIDPVGLDLKVMTKTSDVATSGSAGTEETKTTRARNADGTFSVSAVETSNSDKPPGTEPQSSPSNQPQ